MQTSLTPSALAAYVCRQTNAFFPDGNDAVAAELEAPVESTLQRLEICFSKIRDKRFQKNGAAVFNHLHSDQYAMFLYVLANQAWKDGVDAATLDKLYLLNKALHALDIFYEVELPEVFFFGHPVGSVLGRAKYGNYLVITQSCTVGGIGDAYPVIGKGVVLSSSVNIIGNTVLEDEVYIGAGALLVNSHIPARSTVVGRTPDLKIIPSTKASWREFFFGDSI